MSATRKSSSSSSPRISRGRNSSSPSSSSSLACLNVAYGRRWPSARDFHSPTRSCRGGARGASPGEGGGHQCRPPRRRRGTNVASELAEGGEEDPKISSLMDVKKLSKEACIHAAQNDRLPLRVVLQVLFFEQLRVAAGASPAVRIVAGMVLDDGGAMPVVILNVGTWQQPRQSERVVIGGGQDAMNVTMTDRRAGKFEAKFFHKILQEEIGGVKGHFGPINALAFNPDGRSFSSGGEDGYVRLHHFDSDYFNIKI
ncbi:hypothetical protein OsI_28734 [Oryza sativa Indica Group]|uniref:Serine-threonine kinase receptor-associated protein n=1 Tax=Oryza sativa subsp. indica TaxID=39946 RepID=B8B9K2_ORYSI|nr:hypothetical protein OsI_28734 [Oryza sativa Indica Group]